MKCHNVFKKKSCSQQVLKFVTTKTEQSRESEQALVRRTCQFLFADSRLLVFSFLARSRSKCMFYAHVIICTYFFLIFSPVKPGINGLKAASPLLPVVNCQTCVVDDYTTKDQISFFNVLKHTCIIIFSIDFLIQPPDLNEVYFIYTEIFASNFAV